MSATCIFCKEKFVPEQNTWEHALLNCLGGRLKTNTVDCSRCNNNFGKGIDNEMAQAIQQIRCIGGFRSGDNYLPAPIKNIALKSGRKIDLKPMMVPYDSSVIYNRDKLVNGDLELKMGAGSFEQLAKLLPQFAKGAGLTDEQLISIMGKKDIHIQREQIQEPIHFSFKFGDLGALRSMAKSLVVLWCHKFGNDDFLEENLSDIIKFIIDDDFALSNKKFARIDSRKIPLPQNILDQREFSEHYNLMSVFSDEEGNLYGVFRLYNFVSWIFDFKKKSANKKTSITLISNPFSVDQWKVVHDGQVSLDAEWIRQNHYNLKKAEKYTAHFIETITKRNEKQAQLDMIDEAIRDCFPAEGERIEKEHLDRLSVEVAQRFVEKEFGLNGTRSVSGEQVALIIREQMEKQNKKKN